MSKKKDSTAKKLGRGLAHVQAFVDDALDAGFSALKKFGKKPSSVDEQTPQGKVLKGVKKTAQFFGEMGETFYQKYEQIKSKKPPRK